MPPARKRQRVSPEGDLPVTSDAIPFVPDPDDPDREKHVKKPSAPKTLFVRYLPPDATTESLTEHFSQSYLLKHATVVLDPATKKTKGYGFVTLADPEDTEKAREEFNNALFGGKRMRVEVALPRHRVVEDSAAGGARKSHPAAEVLNAKAERLQKRAEHQSATKLIVRNLPWSVDDAQKLERLFKGYGKIKKAVLPHGKPGMSPGFGFVLFQTRESAEKALEAVNSRVVDGRTLAVDWAVDKQTWNQQVETTKNGDLHDVAEPQDVSMDSESETGGVALEDDDADDASQEDDFSDIGTDEDEEMSDEGDDDENDDPMKDDTGTLFIRNLPFSATDDVLFDHFSQFGALRYSRVVMDHETERSRGTAFICFYKKQDAIDCLRAAPAKDQSDGDDRKVVKHSLLENTMADPDGRFTLDGRVLHLSRAVNRAEANRLTVKGQKYREKKDNDKRRLYLLSEGTITQSSPLYASLKPSERKLREDSAKQRSALVRGNPSLHLSLTRLSIRNIPRFVSSKQLKAVAREAVVGFATDVKAGTRQPLSKEELSRDADAMKVAEKERKSKGKGIVRQAKVVFENKTGSKVSEESGAGRSRGYGFVEYNTHRLALMGLRYLNGHLVQPGTDDTPQSQNNADNPKRLVVEFAIENVQVVTRRREREAKSRHKASDSAPQQPPASSAQTIPGKRKRGSGAVIGRSSDLKTESPDAKSADKSALRNRIIGRKRAKRRARKGP